MSLKNRVSPTGDIHFSSARGTFTGNRGCLHDGQKNVIRHANSNAWITCALEFRGRKRELMVPGQYTHLFFLDEATALAAGHRPCAECRRQRYNELLGAWPIPPGGGRPRAAEVDAVLKRERGQPSSISIAQARALPDGSVVQEAKSQDIFLLLAGKAWTWSFEGYGCPKPAEDLEESLRLLTPPSMVQAIRNGFQPIVHPSARRKG